MPVSSRTELETGRKSGGTVALGGNSARNLRSRSRALSAKQWVIADSDERVEELARSLKISRLTAQLLINRGVSDVEAGLEFLRPKLTSLIRPEEMPGVEPAVRRIRQAVEGGEKITVYGDYDVDGITGVSILWQLLTLLGGDVDYYIPHRIDEGYGLNTDAIRSIAEAGTNVVVTVDCGVTALESAQLAAELGMDLIITDHHQPEPELPKAVTIVHPAVKEEYANQDSAGAMVAFKLAWAIANEFSSGEKLDEQMRQFMLNATSLAAMGTVADVMDLRGENRVLTSYGLRSLSECELCGIQALIASAGLTGKGLDSYDIGFRLAPMLNAAGRMGHARLAVELLTSDKPMRAMQIAEYLKEQNAQRQRRERKIFKQACEMIVAQGANHPDRKSIVLASQDWHTGVIGIVASRIIDKFYRPTVMINAPEDGVASGSGRSIPGFCLLSAIRACSEHLVSFGGHEMAAGITIEADKIEQFAADFEAYAKENLHESDVVAKLHIDAEASLRDFSRAAVNEFQMLGPFGQGNPRPLFATKGVKPAAQPRRVGATNDHLQVTITDGLTAVRCIGFGFGRLEKKLLEVDSFNVAYQPMINNYNGNSNVEFQLIDIQFE
jgi:single-stranded-DNA-specific exonuclease